MAVARQCFEHTGYWGLGLKQNKQKPLFGNSICVCLSEEDKGISEADSKGKEH